MNDIFELKRLKEDHLKNLKELCFQRNENTAGDEKLNDYYQYLYNSIDSKENLKELRKKEETKNETTQKQLENKSFLIDWNLEYCNKCLISYWPRNCHVYILPKFKVNYRNQKIYSKHKLSNLKPKYKSYKDKLLKNIQSNGIRLVFKCLKCNSKNYILKNINRAYKLKIIKSKIKNLGTKLKKPDPKPIINNQIYNINKTKNQLSNESVNKTAIDKIIPASGMKRRFQSLQMKLKMSEAEQEKSKKEKQSSFGNLSDFLQKLS